MNLEGEASGPYNDFVYDDEQQSNELRRMLLDARICEFGPPYARILLEDQQVAGMISCLTGQELSRVRMKAAMLLTKAGVFSAAPDFQKRLKLAGQTLIKPQPDDFYLSRIAIATSERGQGRGSFLLDYFESEGRRLVCRRLTLEVNAKDDAAVRFYVKHGFSEIQKVLVHDESSGRSLEYQQMARALD